MSDTKSELHSFAVATGDVLLTIIGLVIVLTPAFSTINSLLNSPLADPTVDLIVAILAVGGSYPFVTDKWSLGRFGEFVFAFVACAIAVGVLGLIGIVLFGLEISGSNPLPQAIMFAVAYPFAYLLVYRDPSPKSVSADS